MLFGARSTLFFFVNLIQVALHRSLSNLLKAAETRPVNWRRYCASPRLPRLDDAGTSIYSPSTSAQNAAVSAADAMPAQPAENTGHERTPLTEFGIHSPVCVLFALCDSGGGGGTGARKAAATMGASEPAGPTPSSSSLGELQSILWQLLELTLRPEDPSTLATTTAITTAAGQGLGGLPGDALRDTFLTQFAQVALARRTPISSGGGDLARAPRAGEHQVAAKEPAAATPGGNPSTSLVSVAMAKGSTPQVGPLQSPAQLLISQGLVGPGTLVAMAQYLLSPGVRVEARQRTASVLHHLWAANPPESRPEVVHCLAGHLPSATRRGSRAREWLSFLVHAVADSCPQMAPAERAGNDSGSSRAGDETDVKGAGALSPPLRALVRAATAAVKELWANLRNHPNAALYAAIARIIPGAGHYLELEPCLACFEQERRGEMAAGTAAGESEGASGGAAAAATATSAVASAPPGGMVSASASASGGGGAGAGLVFLNYPLDSVKAATKSTESAMLVRFSPLVPGCECFLLRRRNTS